MFHTPRVLAILKTFPLSFHHYIQQAIVVLSANDLPTAQRQTLPIYRYLKPMVMTSAFQILLLIPHCYNSTRAIDLKGWKHLKAPLE